MIQSDLENIILTGEIVERQRDRPARSNVSSAASPSTIAKWNPLSKSALPEKLSEAAGWVSVFLMQLFSPCHVSGNVGRC